jgi:hypothetical protein
MGGQAGIGVWPGAVIASGARLITRLLERGAWADVAGSKTSGRDQHQRPEDLGIGQLRGLDFDLLADPGGGLLVGLCNRAAVGREILLTCFMAVALRLECPTCGRQGRYHAAKFLPR